MECCLKWKLLKGQAVVAEQLAVVAVLAWSPKWKELAMSVVCSWLVMYSNPSLVEKLEVVVVLEELCWQEWVACVLLTAPVVEVLEWKSNCTGIWELCLLLKSRICRYPWF